jgi:hypothetical protein
MITPCCRAFWRAVDCLCTAFCEAARCLCKAFCDSVSCLCTRVVVPLLSNLATGVSTLAGYVYEYVLIPLGHGLSVCASAFRSVLAVGASVLGSLLRLLAGALRSAAAALRAAAKAVLGAGHAASTVVRDTARALTVRR